MSHSTTSGILIVTGRGMAIERSFVETVEHLLRLLDVRTRQDEQQQRESAHASAGPAATT